VRAAAAATLLVLVATATPSARAGSPAFTWTVSASDQDPYVNTSAPWELIQELYVWVIPREDLDFRSSHFDLVASGDLSVLYLLPINGFLTLATPPACGWIYATYCREEPVAGAILGVWSAGHGGALCMSDCDGTNCSVTCDLREYANSYIGFSSDGSAPCTFTTDGSCSPVSVEAGSWGSIKSTYR
jgi:hypothetical protein